MKIAFFEVKDWEVKYLKEQLAQQECVFSAEALGSTMLPRLQSVDVISPFIRSRISAEVVSALPNLALVATRSTGFDHIDLNACAARGITVSNVPSYGENTVAEHTFALMLALSRKIPQTYARVLRGDYSLDGLTGFDIKGRTLSVVGAGRIGDSDVLPSVVFVDSPCERGSIAITREFGESLELLAPEEGWQPPARNQD